MLENAPRSPTIGLNTVRLENVFGVHLVAF